MARLYPTLDVLTVSGLGKINGFSRMEITSSIGQIIEQIIELKEEINVSQLPSGLYFLNIVHEQDVLFVPQASALT